MIRRPLISTLLMTVLLLMAITSSCIGVKLEEHESTFEVLPRVSWPEGFAQEHDTSLFVKSTVFTRIIGERHYMAPYWQWTPMALGKYIIVSFAYPKGAYNTQTLSEYAAKNSFSLRSVRFDVPTYPINQVNAILGRTGKEPLPDMTPDIECLYPAQTLLLGGEPASRTGEFRLPERLYNTSGSQYIFDDKLSVISGNIDIRVLIAAGEGVTINEVVACITGVPSSVNLLTSQVQRGQSGKMWAVMHQGQGGWYGFSEGVLGLIPPINPTFTTGDGVLFLYITASAAGVSRTFIVSHNMSAEIESNPMLTQVDANLTYRLEKKKVTYMVTTPITVNETNILYGEMENNFQWQLSGTIDGSDDYKPVY